MIDVVQYRFRIGTYQGTGAKGRGPGRIHFSGQFRDSSMFNPYNRSESILFYTVDTTSGVWMANLLHSPTKHINLAFFTFIYIYIISLISFCMLSYLVSSYFTLKSLNFNSIGSYLNLELSLVCLMHIKIGYFCLISSIIIKSVTLGHAARRYSIPKLGSSKLARIMSQMLLFILLINFLLIGIVNPSMLNPGPSSLKICYQNVQGLIPIKDLTLKQPSLNVTKICELNAYIKNNRPDVIMLNETWLKKCVDDHEIIRDKNFNIYRNDRTQASHPSDPNNPNKFRRFGGGVLIAIRSDIQADVKRLSVRKGAEILAIEVSINDKKFVFCTLYRVGNLDEPNHASIINTIKTFYKIRNPRKIFIVGDFNLSSISWPLSEVLGNGNCTEKLFIDSFDELGLDQCILGSTHNKGRTLDLLLTNSKNFITDITVFPDKYLCKSDHYLITFEVKSNVKHKKVTKRKILNFKKANWDALNNNLGNIHWDTILDCMEPEIAWLAFKHTLFSHIDKYIPSISVKSDFTSPWFDSECFEAYREKERAHKKFKENSRIEENTQNIIQSDIKFKHKRQLFKNICNRKMRDKFEVFQKKCLEWILSEQELSYSNEVYLRKCKQVNILPLFCRFNLNDMNLFHKIVYKTIPINMPDYLTLYNGNSRLRSTHLDNLSFVTNIASTATSINNLNKSFFFRSHTFWNSLPFDIRNSISLLLFKNKLYKHLWNIALTDIEQYEDEWSFQSSDDDG